eukprot:GHVL01033150.1.p1 GENE.GHVL01033150.1~~GHVL01033150.1.p1  ORF type:complete len:400 (+),score=68.05 GHVL01033150.1:542-1741(+)
MKKTSDRDDEFCGMRLCHPPDQLGEWGRSKYMQKGNNKGAKLGYAAIYEWAHDALKWQLWDAQMFKEQSKYSKVNIEMIVNRKIDEIMAALDRRLIVAWQLRRSHLTGEHGSNAFNSFINENNQHLTPQFEATVEKASDDIRINTNDVEQTHSTKSLKKIESTPLQNDTPIAEILDDLHASPNEVDSVIRKYLEYEKMVVEEREIYSDLFLNEEVDNLYLKVDQLEREVETLKNKSAKKKEEAAILENNLKSKADSLWFIRRLLRKSMSHPSSPRTTFIARDRAFKKFGEYERAEIIEFSPSLLSSQPPSPSVSRCASGPISVVPPKEVLAEASKIVSDPAFLAPGRPNRSRSDAQCSDDVLILDNISVSDNVSDISAPAGPSTNSKKKKKGWKKIFGR